MNSFSNNSKIVLTLDAGGINFVFSAMQGGKLIVEPVRQPSNGNNLKMCLETIVHGFESIIKRLPEAPVAISFAFPGPADYPNGIIGDLGNLSGFRGGVALGPMLKNHFNLPVFINNDGDLFAYGEALGGMLPEINEELENAGSIKRYKNLIGITLGTGFGAGVVINNQLVAGDNSMSAEVWLLSNRKLENMNAEEGVSTRAIISNYEYASGEKQSGLMPYDISQIASAKLPGDAAAAKRAFEMFGLALGDSIANLITLFDGLVVIGGGLTGAAEWYMPAVMNELNNGFKNRSGQDTPRLVQKVYNYNNVSEKESFLKNYSKNISIPGTKITVPYDCIPRTAIVQSKLGASKAISLGAYAFALKHL